MLKGKAKIELHNVKTGEDKVYEDTNLITNHIPHLFSLQMPTIPWLYTTSPFFNASSAEPFGTLLMFENSMDENANNFDLPLDNEVTAHGYINKTSFDTADLTAGIYNANLSSADITHRTMVYDFDMEHGNGVISSICLAPHKVGSQGLFPHKFGSFSTTDDAGFHLWRTGSSANWDDSFRFTLFGVAPNNTYYRPLYFSFEENALYVIQRTSDLKVINIYKVYVDPDNYSIFNTEMAFSSKRIGGNHTKQELIMSIDLSAYTTYVSNPTDLSAGHYDVATKKFYILVNNNDSYSWNKGTVRKLLIIDLQTKEIIQKNVTNTTSVNFSSIDGMFRHAFNSCICDGYIWVAEPWGNLYAINIDNNADVRIVTRHQDNKAFTMSRTIYMVHVCGKLFIYNLDGSTSYDSYVINTKTFNARKIGLNYYYLTLGRNTNYYVQTDDNMVFCTTVSGNSGSDAGVFIPIMPSCMALSTINNLSVPVEKTSDMTMRITYTITNEVG